MTEPSIQDTATLAHEFFTSYVKAGFTEAQALVLVVAMIQKRPEGGADTS